MILGKYSIGIGDRFGRQGKAQLRALMRARDAGVDIVPVWNKSHREHTIVGTKPDAVRAEADAAVHELGWDRPYHVDADHIGLGNVGAFIESSDVFTLDVAEAIGKPAEDDAIQSFVDRYRGFAGKIEVEGIEQPLTISRDQIEHIAHTFLHAVQQAGRIYRHIAAAKGADSFVTEVSMDESDRPQTPGDMLFILAALADEGIPAQTIAPKFTGSFYKGIDYVGDIAAFEREFNADLAMIAYAVSAFDLPPNLKLSVHSGSDKFSLYPVIARALKRFDAGLHLKTAGTTWLEELIGLAADGGEGLAVAKDIYAQAIGRYDELCGPYANVININPDELPSPDSVETWDSAAFVESLRHNPDSADYSPDLRQLLHVAYKIAAEMGERYYAALDRCEQSVAANVTQNLYDRHLKPLFIH